MSAVSESRQLRMDNRDETMVLEATPHPSHSG